MAQQRAVILHGMPDEDEYYSSDNPTGSNSHWLPWLQKELQSRDYDAQTPEVFESYRPQYDLWKAEFERNVSDEPMVLVGHSCGAGFLVRWLSENPDAIVSTLVLVAPWLDPDRDETDDFFEFEIDENLPERVDRFHMFYSTDDDSSILTSVEMILEALPDVIQHRYFDRGHFTRRDLGTVEFPDLLDVLER